MRLKFLPFPPLQPFSIYSGCHQMTFPAPSTHTQTQLCSRAAREDWTARSWTSSSEIYDLLGQHGQRTRDVSDQRGRAVYKYLGIHFSSSQTGPKRFSLKWPSILLRSSGTSETSFTARKKKKLSSSEINEARCYETLWSSSQRNKSASWLLIVAHFSFKCCLFVTELGFYK